MIRTPLKWPLSCINCHHDCFDPYGSHSEARRRAVTKPNGWPSSATTEPPWTRTRPRTSPPPLPKVGVFLFAGAVKYARTNVATGLGAVVTVIPQGEVIRLPTSAHMLVVPAPTAVAMPLVLIEAACGALLVQAVTELPLASGSVATDPSE